MHLKAAVVSLLMLSSFIIQSSALSVETRPIQTDASPTADIITPITVGPYSLFASALRDDPTYAFNVDSSQTAVFDLTISDHFAYTIVNDELLVYGGGRSVEDTFKIFNVTSQQKSTASYGVWNYGNSFVSFENKVMIVGGAVYVSDGVDLYYCRIYDTATQAMTNCSLPSPSYFKRSAVVGDYAVFAGGNNYEPPVNPGSNSALVFNSVTQTWTTTTVNVGGDDVQSVSIGRFAIFVGGNIADIFDSNTQSWTTHTLSQNASSAERGYSITKTSRYAFFVGVGVADVFDSQSQSWSTLDIDPSTEADDCPSTAVDDYAVFACDYKIMVYNTITKEFIQNFTVERERIEYLLQAGSVGKVATFFYGTLYSPYMRIIDFTGFPPAMPSTTPVAPAPVSTPSSPSTPTTVPWSPWTAPVSSTPRANNQPVANSPSVVVIPLSPNMNSPSTTNTPVSDNNNSPIVSGGNPDSSSSPSSSSSPNIGNPSQVTVGAPENESHHEATSSSSVLISITDFVSVIAVVCLLA